MTELSGYTVVMPRLGLTMVEATLVAWNKKDGDRVEKGELLFTLESDKSSLEIEAPTSGIVKLLIPAGKTVPVNSPIAVITDSQDGYFGVDLPSDSPVVMDVHPVNVEQKQVEIKTTQGVKATPKARYLARERGINLAKMTGSGPRNMVVTDDLNNILNSSQPVRATPLARRAAAEAGVDLAAISGSGPRGQVTRDDVEKASAHAEKMQVAGIAVHQPVKLPLTGLRALIAERLTSGWNERPQVTLVTELDATNLVSAREQISSETGQKISYNAFFMKAVAQTLQEQSHVNIRLSGSGLLHLEEVNIGLAVDTERGLLVPVLRDVNRKKLLEISHELNALAQRAIEGRSTPDELSGGCLTITNLGVYGIDAFTPIINPPEIAILGIGRISPRPSVWNGQLAVRETLTLSLSFDHRLLDGAPAARFLQRVVQLLECPIRLLAQ